MLYEETPGLEKFVSDYLQRAGALTEQESYASLGVLFPDDLRRYFGEEQLLLGSTGQVQMNFFQSWQKNIPAEEREYSLPRAKLLLLDGLYQTACRNAEQVTQIWAEKIMKQEIEK